MKTKWILFTNLLLLSINIYGGEYEITDVKIFEDTPVWNLAIAVQKEDYSSIKKELTKNPKLVNSQEPKYGATLLLWSIGMEKYQAAKTLLECGADPNIASKDDGSTPLFVASEYSWIDTFAKQDPKYVILLLKYGADPNKNYIGFNIPGHKDIIEAGESPLMNSIPCGLEKTKALVEAGAVINHKTKSGRTAATTALLSKEFPEYAYYLIVDKNAKVNEPYTRGEIFSVGKDDPNELFYPVDILRNWIFDLDSKEYKIKMKIVNEFARQGVNYWETKINKRTMERIKKLYPKNWEEYIKKY